MSVTMINDVADQVGKIWSPMFSDELREQLLLGGIVSKKYSGSLTQMNDTVYVSQINAPEGELRTIGTDSDSFNSEKLETQRVAIQANKRAVAAVEFEDIVELQSQLGQQDSAIRQSLLYAVSKQVNDYLYSLIAPSSSAPDHTVTGVTTFNVSELVNVRTLAAQAKWLPMPGWYGLLSPQYYGDLLQIQQLGSSDYGVQDAPVIGGQIAQKRFGFNLFEDNSRSGDYGLFLHPDAIHLVMQQEARFKLSDQHAMKKFGYVLSVDLVFGAALGIDGSKKMITVTS